MDPRKDPTRRCMRLDLWPDSDRQAWQKALTEGDIFDPGSFASTWQPLTRYTVERAYGRWLTWLDTHQLLDHAARPAGRASPENVAGYVQDLQAVNASYTVLARVRHLCNALQAMAPDQDWDWLRRLARGRRRVAVSSRNKRKKMVPSDELFAYGVELMETADHPTGRTPLAKADRFRDGLMVALLAARPIRRRNLTSIEIGRHLVRQGSEYWLRFEGAETKTGMPIDDPLPAALTPYLERYLTHYRPYLCRRKPRGNRLCKHPPAPGMSLWVSQWSSAMSQGAVYGRIIRATRAKFGHALSPHLFRDCAATSIAIADPDHVRITTRILGHSTIATSEQHYNHAQSLVATRRHQDNILALRRPSRDGVGCGSASRSPKA